MHIHVFQRDFQLSKLCTKYKSGSYRSVETTKFPCVLSSNILGKASKLIKDREKIWKFSTTSHTMSSSYTRGRRLNELLYCLVCFFNSCFSLQERLLLTIFFGLKHILSMTADVLEQKKRTCPPSVPKFCCSIGQCYSDSQQQQCQWGR